MFSNRINDARHGNNFKGNFSSLFFELKIIILFTYSTNFVCVPEKKETGGE